MGYAVGPVEVVIGIEGGIVGLLRYGRKSPVHAAVCLRIRQRHRRLAVVLGVVLLLLRL